MNVSATSTGSTRSRQVNETVTKIVQWAGDFDPEDTAKDFTTATHTYIYVMYGVVTPRHLTLYR